MGNTDNLGDLRRLVPVTCISCSVHVCFAFCNESPRWILNPMKNKKNKGKAVTESAGSSVARVTEIIASSAISFEDAVAVGVARACKTLEGVTGAWVQDQKIDVKDGEITNYRVNLKVTFVLKD